LDAAYRGPYPARSTRAMRSYVERWSRQAFPDGRTNDQLAWVEKVRAKVATLLCSTPEEVLFTRSTTDGICLVANSLLKPGDEILVGGLDHPADYAVWLHLATKGVGVTLVPHRGGSIAVEDLASAIGPSTRAIGLCLVNTYNGYRQDIRSLGQLCSEHGLYLFLDGIQAVGHLDIDLQSSNVTVLGAGVYKWLCSPEGLGIAYVNKRVLSDIRPETPHFYNVYPKGDDGWGGFISQVFCRGEEGAGPQTLEPDTLYYPPSAKRLETSCNFLALVGLEAMLDLLLEVGGMAVVERRVLQLTAHLREMVQDHGHKVLSSPSPKNMSGITSVAVPDARKFSEYCQQRGIWVLPQASLKRDTEAVRVSTHIFNNKEDVAEFTRALDMFVKDAV